VKIDIQRVYEEILSSQWQKIFSIRELEETNRSNHPLRIKSIADRKKELLKIEQKKEAMELLFFEDLIVPEWYNNQIRGFKVDE
jgi:hypothetical protein